MGIGRGFFCCDDAMRGVVGRVGKAVEQGRDGSWLEAQPGHWYLLGGFTHRDKEKGSVD
jgi:hypothetical protein